MIDKECWIAFKHGSAWTQRFLKKDFGHAFIISKDKFNWMLIDPTFQNLNISILPYGPDDDVIQRLRKNHRVVYVRYSTNGMQSFFSFISYASCTKAIRYVIGLKVFCITPYGLYKKLAKLSRQRLPYNIKEIRVLI